MATLSKRWSELNKDELLGYLGLETKRGPADWVLPTLGIFGLGVLVGAGVGMMLAPKSGAELREDVKHRLQGGMAGTFSQGTSAQIHPPA